MKRHLVYSINETSTKKRCCLSHPRVLYNYGSTVLLSWTRENCRSNQLTVRGHCYDALVGVAGCDKSTRINDGNGSAKCPCFYIVVHLPGRFNGKDVTVVDVFEGRKYSSRCIKKIRINSIQWWAIYQIRWRVFEAIGLALPIQRNSCTLRAETMHYKV